MFGLLDRSGVRVVYVEVQDSCGEALVVTFVVPSDEVGCVVAVCYG
jgi:hypothetical protein